MIHDRDSSGVDQLSSNPDLDSSLQWRWTLSRSSPSNRNWSLSARNRCSDCTQGVSQTRTREDSDLIRLTHLHRYCKCSLLTRELQATKGSSFKEVAGTVHFDKNWANGSNQLSIAVRQVDSYYECWPLENLAFLSTKFSRCYEVQVATIAWLSSSCPEWETKRWPIQTSPASNTETSKIFCELTLSIKKRHCTDSGNKISCFNQSCSHWAATLLTVTSSDIWPNDRINNP